VCSRSPPRFWSWASSQATRSSSCQKNRVEWIYCDLAIQSVGAVTVPIYPSSPPELAQKIAADSGAMLAIASGVKLAGRLNTTAQLRLIVRIDTEVAQWVTQEPTHINEIASRLEKIQPDEICTIVYTSGTTGEPKGAELAHRNLVDMSRAILKVFPLGPDDSTLSFLPYSHVFERINESSSASRSAVRPGFRRHRSPRQ